jgi:serine/threonine protein kinase
VEDIILTYYYLVKTMDYQIRNMQKIYISKRSTIYRGIWKNNPIAVKHIPKRYCKMIENIPNEVNVLQQLQNLHHVVRYIDTIENERDIFIIMEWINGMNLKDYVQSLDKPLSENTIKEIVKPLVGVIRTCNQLNMIYGDIKPENIMIEPFGKIKLIDFGCTRKIGSVKNSYIGTPLYFSPEMFNQVCLPEYDSWGIGIIIYYMASGKHPFVEHIPRDLEDLKYMICNNPLQFNDVIWNEWTEEGKEFIASLLEKDPFKRANIYHAYMNHWFDL